MGWMMYSIGKRTLFLKTCWLKWEQKFKGILMILVAPGLWITSIFKKALRA